MGNTYSQIFIHLVFSTKLRAPKIKQEFEAKLKSFIIKTARKFEVHIIAIGGTSNHLHVLFGIPPKISVSKAAQIIKGSSSKWLNDHFFDQETFRWQRGYGAFSINKSLVPTTINYIKRQKEHHAKIAYQDEFNAILDKHNINQLNPK